MINNILDWLNKNKDACIVIINGIGDALRRVFGPFSLISSFKPVAIENSQPSE